MFNRFLLLSALMLSVILIPVGLLAQDADGDGPSGSDIQFGVGLRFTPSVIAYNFPFMSDSALLSALIGRMWIGDRVGVEAGGWIYQMRDHWSKNMNRLLTAGILYKWVDGDPIDFLVAVRGLSYLGRSTSRGYDCPIPLPIERTPPDSEPEPHPTTPIPPPYCEPSYDIENRSLTLAGMLTGGLEWAPAPEVGLDLEFGLIYSQMISENHYPPRPYPTDKPLPLLPPPPPIQPEVFSSSQLGLVVAVSVVYHF